MRKVSSVVGVVAALITTPLLGLPARGADCPVMGDLSVYTAAGFSCSVGPMTFSNIVVAPTIVDGSGVLSFLHITPYSQNGEFGLQLNFFASTGPSAGGANQGHVDFIWSFDVTGVPAIGDAFLGFVAFQSGTGVVAVSELLSNGVTLEVAGTGSDFETFSPITSLHVTKDTFSLSGLDGFSSASSLINAFSVPGPIAGAGLPGLLAACGGLLALARRRRQKRA
jgi:hypothetical protein